MKAYQQEGAGKKKRVLMVRPTYPLVCLGNDKSVIDAAAGSVVVVNGDWGVGDLVDWFTDGCFWAAKIAVVISKDTVKVELPSAPLGEGGSYEAAVKDIRPSLDWSAEQKLWTVPVIKSHSNIHWTDDSSGRVSSPVIPMGVSDKDHFFVAKQDPARTTVGQGFHNIFTGREEAQTKRKFSSSLPEKATASDVRLSNSSVKASESFPARVVKASPVDMVGRQSTEASLNRSQEQGRHVERGGCTEPQQSVPQIDATGSSIAAPQTVGSSGDGGEAALFEEFNALLGEGKCLDLSDERIGSSIVALEELISKVAWLKGVVQFGLKGWDQEVRKKKWALNEGQVPSVGPSQQDVDVTPNLGQGLLTQEPAREPCLSAFHNAACKAEPL